jgi:hypothetical protein
VFENFIFSKGSFDNCEARKRHLPIFGFGVADRIMNSKGAGSIQGFSDKFYGAGNGPARLKRMSSVGQGLQSSMKSSL